MPTPTTTTVPGKIDYHRAYCSEVGCTDQELVEDSVDEASFSITMKCPNCLTQYTVDKAYPCYDIVPDV